jgi:anti-sigma B factor antagonist
MSNASTTMVVRRIDEATSIIEIHGDMNGDAEPALMDAVHAAEGATTRTIILDFGHLDYMNSSGIGLLVTLLIRVNRQKQRLLATGLSDHYRNIFELTRLNEAIHIYNSEAEALRAARGA